MLKISIINLSNKMPDWAELASAEYVKRLKEIYSLSIITIPLIKRTKTSDLSRITNKEMQLMEQAIPAGSYLISLNATGKIFNSEQLADKFSKLQLVTSHLCFLIGGPEGLSPLLNAKCQESWSLSSLTLPHTLAKIVFLEAVYRSWCINNQHPYHK